MDEKRERGLAGTRQDEDLRRNPGIGQSIGTSRAAIPNSSRARTASKATSTIMPTPVGL